MSLISVVIPAFNQARFVGAAVRSALSQTHEDVEVVVVNDGSTDHTPEVLAEFAAHPQVRLVTQANADLPAARNRGLAKSGGEFVCFLDADDLLEPPHLARLAAPLSRDTALGFAYCDVQQVDEQGAPAGDFSVGASRRQLSGDILDSLLMGGYFPPHAALVRRSMLDSLGGFDLELGGHADYEMWLRAVAAGWKTIYIDEKLARYRVYPGSMSRDLEHMRQTRLAALERVIRNAPRRVAASLSSLQALATDLHTANVWLRDQLSERIAAAAVVPPDGPAGRQWHLLPHLAQATLVSGQPDHLAVWETTLGGRFARAVYLHPPSTLRAVVPIGAAGHLTAALAIHPDAWTKPRACACTFLIDVDRTVAATVLLDPARREADRRWIDITLAVPASATGEHLLTMETQAVGAPSYGWALLKDVRFTAE